MHEQQNMSAAASAFGSSLEPEAGESLLQQQQQQQAAALKCPRCESSNTKFCYYNNYNLSQPRHFCKNCRRYWTKGGALRNIPVGGGTRKNSSSSSSSKRSNSTPTGPTTSSKRPSTSDPEPQPSSASSSSLLLYPNHPPAPPPDAVVDHELDFTGTFSSLLHSNGHFENILDVSSPPVSAAAAAAAADLGDLNRSNDDNLLSWANGWTDLAIYTPGSTFQ